MQLLLQQLNCSSHDNCSSYNNFSIYFNHCSPNFNNYSAYDHYNSRTYYDNQCSSYYNNCCSYDHDCSTFYNIYNFSSYDNHNNSTYYNTCRSINCSYQDHSTCCTYYNNHNYSSCYNNCSFYVNHSSCLYNNHCSSCYINCYSNNHCDCSTFYNYNFSSYDNHNKLTDTSFAIDLGFKITNVTQESLSNRLTLTNETELQIQDSINKLLHKVLSEPDGKQFQFPIADFIDDGTEITANVTYVYKEEDVNHPSSFLQEVLKVSGLLTTTVAPTTTTSTTPLPTLLTSVTSTTRFGTVGVFVQLIFKVKTPVPTENDVLGAVKKQLSPQFTTTQTTFQNATYIKLTDTSFAIDLGFKITNLHKVLSEPDGKQFQFPIADFIDDGTEITANVTYVYKEEDVNHPSSFLQEVLKVSGLLTTTVAPTTTTSTTPLPTLLTSVTSTTRFGTVGVFVKLIFKVKTPVPTENDVLGAVKNQLSPQFTTTQTTFQNATYIKLTDTSFAIDLGFKITNLHKVLSEPDGKQFQFPIAEFIDDGTEITANVTYEYKEEDVNHPSSFLQEVLKVSGLLTTTVAPTTTTSTTPLPTLLTSVTSTTRFGTVGVFVKLIFKVKTPVPTENDVLGAVKKQLSPQFTTTQTTFQNATYIKLTDTSFAIDLGFKITNVTQESLSNRLTLTNETKLQIQDSINKLLHKVLSEPDGKQFQFPIADFIDDGTEITANVTYVYKEEDVNHPSSFLQEVLKVSGLLTTTVAPTTTTSTTPLPTLLTSVTSTTRFGTVGVFVKLIFKVKTPVPTENDVLGAVKKQLSPQFTTTQTTFQNATYIKLTDTSFAIDLGFKITNVTQESLSNRLTLTNETKLQIQDSINKLLHKVLSEPDGKQFQFPIADFIDDGTEITANVTYVYKEEDVNHPSSFLQEVLKVSGLLTTTVAPTTTTSTTPLPTLLTSVTSTTRFGTVGVFVKLIFKVKTPVPTEDDVLGAVKKQLSPQFTTTQTTFQNATYIKLTDTSFAIDLGFKITNVTQESLSNRLTLTNETKLQIQDSINKLLHKVLSEPDGKQFQFPIADFIDDGTEITANVTYVYKEEDVNHPSSFLQEVLKVSGLLTTTVAPTTTTSTTPLPTLLTSVTSTTRFGTVGVFVQLIFKVKTPVPTEDDVLGAVKKQLSPQFTTTQTTFQNATYIKLTDTSFAIDLGFKITNVTQESLSNRLTLTNETKLQIQDSINKLLHKVLSEPDGKQFQFPIADFIDDGTEITANVTYVYKEEDVNHPSSFLQEVLKVSGLLTTTVAPTTTTSTTPLPTLLTSVTSTTRFGTVGVFVQLIFKVKTPVPTEDDVLGAVKKQLSPQFTTTQTTFQNATYIKLTDTSFAIDLGFKITNVTQESLSNRLTLINETKLQIQDSINKLLHKVLSEPDGKQFQFPIADFIDDGTEITANVTYVYKEEDVNHPSSFLQEVLKVSGLLTTTVAPTTTTSTTPLPTLLTSVTSTTRFGTVGVFVQLIFKVKTPVPTEDDVLGAVKKQLSPQFTTTQTTFQNATYIKLTDTSFAIDLGFKITNVTQESLSNRLTLTNETKLQIQDSINKLLHKVLSEPDGKQFQFPIADFIDDGTEITANVTYVYKEEDVNHPSSFLQEVLKVSGLLTTTVAPTTTTSTTPLPTLLTSVTSTTRFGTVGVFVQLIFKDKTPVPTEDDVLGAVKKQLSPQFTTTQTTFQNLHKVLSEPDGKQFQFPIADFIDDGTEITANVTYVYKEEDVNHPSSFLQEVLKVSGLLTTTVAPTTTTSTTPLPTLLTSVTSTTRFGTVGVFVQLIFKVKTPVPTEDDVLGAVKKQMSPQFTTTQTTFQNATYIKLTDTSFAIDLGFKITNVTQESLSNRLTLTNETKLQIQDSINKLLHKVLSEPDGKQFQFPIADFIDDGTEITANVTYVYKEEDVNHPSSFLQEVLKVSGLLTTTVAPTTTTSTTPLPTLLTSVTSTTRFGTVGVFVQLIFKVKTPVPTEDDVLGAVKKQLSPQFTTTQTTFQNATYIKLTDTSFAIDLGFKITNVTQESLSNRLTLTNETKLQIQDSINKLLHKVLSEPDGKQFQFPIADFIDDGTEITANVTYVYKEEDVNHPSSFLQEVLKVSGLLTTTVAPTTTTSTTPLPTLLTSVTSTTRFGTVGVFVQLIFKVKTPVPTEDDVLGAVKKQLSPQFTTTQTTFQNATYIKLTDTSFAIDLGFKITNVTQESLSNRLTLTNETKLQIQDSINKLLHKVLSEPDGKQFQFPIADFIDDGTEITANVTYVYKEEDVNHPSSFLQEVLKVSGLLTTTVAPTTTTSTTPLPTLLTSVTSTTRFGTVGVFVQLIFKVKTPVPTEDDVLGAVKKQLSPQFTTTQTTFQNATYIKLTDTSFAIDLGFKITNVTQESLSNRLTLTNETKLQIQDSINKLLHKVLSEPDGKQFQFPIADFIDDGTEITANVTYVYKEEDVNHPSSFLQEVLKVSGLLTTTVAPTTTTSTTPLPTLLTSVTSTTRFGTVGVFVQLIFKVKTPVPTEDDVLGAVKKQLSPQFTTTQTTFQNATYIKLTDTSFAIDLGFKITNVTQESLSNRLTLTNETKLQIQDSINKLLHKVLSEPDGKQFQFPIADFIDDGTEITANVTYVYKEEDVNHPSSFLQEVLKVSGLLTTTVAPTTTTSTTPLPTLLTSVTSTTRFGTVGVFVQLIFKVKTPVPTEDDVLGAVKKQLSPQFTTTQTTFQNATYIKLTDTSFAIDLGFKITNVTQESLSNRLTLTNETKLQIQDSINKLLHKVLSEPDGKQFQFPIADFIDDGTEITANVTYVYKEEDVNHPSSFLQEVLKVSGLLTTTVAPTTTTSTTPLPTLLTSVTSTTRFGTVGVFVQLIFKVKTPVPTEDDVLGAVKKQLSPQFTTTQTTFQNATYIKLTDTSFAIDLGFKITNVTQESLSNRLTLTNETKLQIQDSINKLLHKVLSEPDGKQFQFPIADFIDDGTEITANVTYVYKEEDVNHPSSFLQEVLKVSGLLTTTVAPTTTTSTTPLPTLLTSVTSTTRFGTVGVFVQLIFKVKTPVPTEDDVLGAVKKQLSPQFTTTQTTFQNATYIKLTDTSFAIDLGFKITNVTQESLSNRLTLTNETKLQIQDSINKLLHKVLSEPDGKQFQFPIADFIDDGTEITANVTYVYKEEDVNHPSSFLQEVLKVSGLLTTTVAPTTTTSITPLPTLLTSVTSTTRFGTVGVFVQLIFKVKTPVPTEDDVLGAVKKQLSPQFTTTQTTFQNATYIKLTDTSFAIDLGFKITNVTQESLSNRLTLTNETKLQIQDSINKLLHKVLSEPDGKQFQFPIADFMSPDHHCCPNNNYQHHTTSYPFDFSDINN
ncbi:mucin-3A-like [Salvelinus alpinus]|uniref:mucin-3A-like n=1 Tax=Salvelinus alpinus TaxID=8036 RepID=UPI0039FC4B33